MPDTRTINNKTIEGAIISEGFDYTFNEYLTSDKIIDDDIRDAAEAYNEARAELQVILTSKGIDFED